MLRVVARALAIGALASLFVSATARADVQVSADMAQRQLTVGDAAPLVVSVSGTGRVDAPVFNLPDGLQLLGSSRSQSVSFINGRMSQQIQFRFEIGAMEPGRYTIGPIDVRADGKVFRSPPIALDVMSSDRRVGSGGGGGPASLVVDATPRAPYVGQPVTLRVRLIQRSSLAEDSDYQPPPTPGFWSERPSQQEVYYADDGRSRVLITETRARLYPLAEGKQTIGEAVAVVALAIPGGNFDPMQWLRGQVPRREVILKSRPVDVHVRPLPGGAPSGFDGAVGSYALNWTSDRSRTARDVPFTLRLQVRGNGNVPLLRAPEFAAPDIEVLGQTLDDSLATPGTDGVARRAFVWTVLPRREGRVSIPAPRFAWFDPIQERYRVSAPMMVAIDVGPALGAERGDPSGLPTVFASHPIDPRARRASPWAYGLAGLAMGAAMSLWRSTRARPDLAVRDTERRRLLARLRAATGDEFWGVAEEVSDWLEAAGKPQRVAQRAIEAARYGGVRSGEADVRRALDGALVHAAPPAGRSASRRLAAGGLALAAIALVVGFGPWPGAEATAARVRAADKLARDGRVREAAAVWTSVWAAGVRHPALAARIAWAHLEGGVLPAATLWVLRGDRVEARDPALHWVVERVRETGGLVGFTPTLPPVKQMEWALGALVLGLVASLTWPRRRTAVPALALAVLCAAIGPLAALRERAWTRAIVRAPVVLEGTGIELEPGQVVTVVTRAGERMRVRAGRDAEGWVPAATAVLLERAR